MADPPGVIPSPSHQLTDDKGFINRTWWRVLNVLGQQSGVLQKPITVSPNSFFVSGDLNSGSTLDPATITSGTLLGNSSSVMAAATPQTVDTSLSLSGGVLALAKLAAGALLGNAGSVAAIPSEIAIGSGLTLTPGTPPVLNVAAGSTGTDLSGAQTLSWWRS